MIRTLIRANRKTLIWTAILIIAILAALTVWYKNIYSDPRRVFQAMLENSLRTTSVTKQVIQGDEVQSLDQVARLQNGEDHNVQSITTLSQSGSSSATVVTESIGTPTNDFVRYRSIDTDQRSTDGGDLDFSQVLGVWGNTAASGETTGELYNETVLGVIPIGNVPAEDREKLMEMISELDVYKVEYSNVKRGTVNGRASYEYTVKVLPEAYVTLLKAYASAVGLTHLQNINPASYENSDPIEFKVVVDIMSHRLAKITYGTGRVENYFAYGNTVPLSLPEETITVEELQQRVQSVQ